MENNPNNKRSAALQLIILFGLVSLFGDIVYEASRSVNGQYLNILGVNAATVGLIIGIGEFFSYFIRLVAGYLSDKTKAYWFFTLAGYFLIISVPMISLTSSWQVVALLIISERIGKAIRSPSRDAILSHATKQVGTGFGFGLHEAMDQIGAIAGPLIFAAIFFILKSSRENISNYQVGYRFLWIPFILMMSVLVLSYIRMPQPEKLETSRQTAKESEKLPKVFWLYVIFSFITTVGFLNFVLIAFHFKARNIFTDAQIPIFYAIAMAVDGIAALIIGKIYDRLKVKSKNGRGGLFVLIVIPVLSLLIPVLLFLQSTFLAIISVLIWGLVMGAHETIMRSSIADITSLKKRGTGYGVFNTGYGLALFVGTSLMGLLYDYSVALLISFAVIIEVIAIMFFFILRREVLLNS
ncbi:MAG: MFS transporter [Candidatus Omnitrophota bacterium]